MSDNIYWILEIEIKEGELDNFKALMNEMVEATQTNEPNTLNYEWCISEDSKNCHIYERYLDSSATMLHLGSFGENFAERFMGIVQVKRFIVYGKPDDEVKNALAGFGTKFMTPIGGFVR